MLLWGLILVFGRLLHLMEIGGDCWIVNRYFA